MQKTNPPNKVAFSQHHKSTSKRKKLNRAHRTISTSKSKPVQPNYLINEFPTTSTKFSIKTRLKDTEGNFIYGKILPPPREQDISPTTWDFNSLYQDSFLEMQKTSKEQAARDTIRDEHGNVQANVENLAQFDEPTLMQIALGVGDFKPVAKNVSKQTESVASTLLKKKVSKKSNQQNSAISIELDADGNDADPLSALRRHGTESHPYAGFLDPVSLPTFITTPPLANLHAARVLGFKLISRSDQLDAQSFAFGESPQQLQTRQTHSRQFRDQALLWFARASHAGDFESTSQMMQIHEQELFNFIGITSSNLSKDNQQSDNDPDNSTDTASQPNQNIRLLTPTIKLQIEITYEEAMNALLPRLQGKQIQGVDYRTMNPFISTLFYYETLIEQSTDSDALLSFCEWMFSMDELFTQLISTGGANDTTTTFKQGEYITTTESFIGGYLQGYLKPLTLHRIHGETASALLESLSNSRM